MLGGPVLRRLTPASGERGVEGCGPGNAAVGGGEWFMRPADDPAMAGRLHGNAARPGPPGTGR